MINGRKTIAVFTCHVTTGYRKTFCEALNLRAAELGYNVVYFNFMGIIGNRHRDYGEYEYKFVDVIPFGQFCGIILDEDAFAINKVIIKLIEYIKKKAECPVVSMSSYIEDFYNLVFDDTSGIDLILDHLYNEHGCRKIGYMSGPHTHTDAAVRYDAFKRGMVKLGLPENGIGVFEGDFWFNRGKEAADFFFSEHVERPDAIVCANDYMAMALCTALKEKGMKIPDDIIVTGFDGTEEGQLFVPRLTTIDRRREETAHKAVELIDRICSGEVCPKRSIISAKLIKGTTCGCEHIDFENEIERVNLSTIQTRTMTYYLGDLIGATLNMNIVESIEDLGKTFVEHAVNFGEYRSFCLMTYLDEEGRSSLERGMLLPTNKVYPSMLIDRWGDFRGCERRVMSTDELLPEESNNDPKIMYVTSMHCGDKCFGYCSLAMKDHRLFNEFFNVWVATLAMALESLLRRNNIQELITTLEDTSVRDGLTGLYNRRGFESRSAEAARTASRNARSCAMVIDMDGLKKINDIYGHSEGDFAIKTLAKLIKKCCGSSKIVGRTGGDEFYVFVSESTEEDIEHFQQQLNEKIRAFNEISDKPYKLDASFGACLHEIDTDCDVEELLRLADERMYKMKQHKKRKRGQTR